MTATVQHLVLPASVMHPWKGEDLWQDSRSIYIANGSGSGVWTPHGVGQIYFQGTATVAAPAAYTRFAPVADYTASGFALSVTEGDDEVTWTDGQSVYASIMWSITLAHTNAGAQDVFVSLGNATVVTGFERTVHSATLAQNIETCFSGRYLKKIASNDTFSIYVKAAAGDVTVSSARLSLALVY